MLNNALDHGALMQYVADSVSRQRRPPMKGSIQNFRDDWLESFFVYATPHKLIPATIETALARKLDIIHAATSHHDLRSPPGNRFEALRPPLIGYFSVRINAQYRLIFQWNNGKVSDLYPHSYRQHR